MVDNKEDPSQIVNFKLVDQKYYLKNKRLGKGNFAETFLATLKDDETKIYACKMIAKNSIIEKLKNSKNQEQRKEYIINSLKNEVQLWKQLDHPNIVKFIDFSETPNNIYFFLEYCDSGDLEKELKRRNKFSEAEGLIIMKQIVDGCCFLYDKGVFHRDIKPENILMHKNAAKIADFGFAKVIEEEKRDMAFQQTAVGTPFYMAPQVLECKEYSIKCDVWSLGVMFYQMLYGFLPWSDNQSIQELVKKVKTQQLHFPPSIPVSETMKGLIVRMLTVDEEKRIGIKEASEIINKLMSK